MLFINGWASNASVWGDLPALAAGQCYDLAADKALQDYRQKIPARLEQHKIETLVGWSLGGMVALEIAAAFPQQVKRLILLGTTAKFTVDASYPHGLPLAVVKQLARKVQRDPLAAQEQFYPLMFSAHEQEAGRLFQGKMAQSVMTSNQALLQEGLDFLAAQDLRSLLPKITARTQIIHGLEDAICPFGAAEYLAA